MNEHMGVVLREIENYSKRLLKVVWTMIKTLTYFDQRTGSFVRVGFLLPIYRLTRYIHPEQGRPYLQKIIFPDLKTRLLK